MAIQVRGYTKHVNGKLVTVHGYTQDSRIGTNHIRQIPQNKPHYVAAEPGIHQWKSPSAQRLHGLAPHAIFPANRFNPKPEIVWARSRVFGELFINKKGKK